MAGGGQARCLRVSKMSPHVPVCAPGYLLNFPSHILAVSSQSYLVALRQLPAQGVCGGVVVQCFPLGFVFLYLSCKCYGTEGSFCMQACASKMACCCWCPMTRIQPRSAVLSAMMRQDSRVFPSPPGAGLGSIVKAQKLG